MPYDQRFMSWKGVDRVSLLTLNGREIIPFVFGQYQQLRFKNVRGQVDLLYRDGRFFLAVVVDVPEPPPERPEDFLGVDLGIQNIAADSDGKTYTGGKVNGIRSRHSRLRRRLQSKGTKSAKQLLKKRRRKESLRRPKAPGVVSLWKTSKVYATG
jgi:putative transposase